MIGKERRHYKFVFLLYRHLKLCFLDRPAPGDIRQICIEKSSEQLGITIEEGGAKKGVFVSSVSENSLASQVGLQVRPSGNVLLAFPQPPFPPT